MTAMTLQELGEYIVKIKGDAVLKHEVTYGELAFVIRREQVADFIKFLKTDDKCEFNQLANLCGADYPEREERFDVVYNLLSLKHNQRIRVIAMVGEGASIATIETLYSSAGWFEREVYDMYGITFEGHADLRRILTDYGFEGHPLRKDFPLTGFVELRYDEEQQRIVSEPVTLTQDFRNFDFVSPWEGMTTVQLPGDEKAAKPKVSAK